MEKIDLEKQFQFFLNKAGLTPSLMAETELKERRITFYAGMSQMYKLFLEISELPEADCTAVFDEMDLQLNLFWRFQK